MLGRLGRDSLHLLEFLDDFRAGGNKLRSLYDGIVTDPGRELVGRWMPVGISPRGGEMPWPFLTRGLSGVRFLSLVAHRPGTVAYTRLAS
ncbi:hypothetical protein AAGW05_14975 [Arthrobacter sp. LAPM80]|uniref:hypothetical protein n=1 Tax=Arthrobacter sp. LAPM80 TaxID=3141788 RepID=UPI00398B497A